MVDTLSPEQRSRLMSRIRGKDTSPEMTVRRMVHALGYRFRLHRRGLPGSPDLVFPSRRKAIWVHGCFWHWHPSADCPIAKIPKSRREYWIDKFSRNRARDERTAQELEGLGWTSMTIWECQLRPGGVERTLAAVEAFLSDRGDGG